MCCVFLVHRKSTDADSSMIGRLYLICCILSWVLIRDVFFTYTVYTVHMYLILRPLMFSSIFILFYLFTFIHFYDFRKSENINTAIFPKNFKRMINFISFQETKCSFLISDNWINCFQIFLISYGKIRNSYKNLLRKLLI